MLRVSEDETEGVPHVLERVVARDRTALGRLVADHVSWIRGLVRREVGELIVRRFDVEDCTQDVLAELLRSLHRSNVRSLSQFRCLVRRRVHQSLCNKVSYLRAVRRDASRERTVEPDVLVAEALEPGQEVARRELCETILAALDTLRDSDRRLVELRHWRGMGFSAISDRLGIGPDAARMRYHRLLDRLRRALRAPSPKRPPLQSLASRRRRVRPLSCSDAEHDQLEAIAEDVAAGVSGVHVGGLKDELKSRDSRGEREGRR